MLWNLLWTETELLLKHSNKAKKKKNPHNMTLPELCIKDKSWQATHTWAAAWEVITYYHSSIRPKNSCEVLDFQRGNFVLYVPQHLTESWELRVIAQMQIHDELVKFHIKMLLLPWWMTHKKPIIFPIIYATLILCFSYCRWAPWKEQCHNEFITITNIVCVWSLIILIPLCCRASLMWLITNTSMSTDVYFEPFYFT